jgi:hypothetical protein
VRNSLTLNYEQNILENATFLRLTSFGFIGKLYSYFVCLLLWFFVFQTFILMFFYVNCETVHLLFGNITFFIENYKLYYLLPKFLYSVSIAITATNFIIYDREVVLKFIYNEFRRKKCFLIEVVTFFVQFSKNV